MKNVKILHMMVSSLVALSLASIMAVAPASAENAQGNGVGDLTLAGNYSIIWQELLDADETSGAAGAQIVPDMDGDSKADVLVRTTKYDSSTDKRTATVTAKKGTNGTHLWEESLIVSGEYGCEILPLQAGDLDGDGLGDVVVLQYERPPSAYVATWKVIAKKGIDGTHLWEESLVAAYMGASPMGDLDSDGLNDVMVWQLELDAPANTMTAKVIAKKGTDGTHLWEESVSGIQCSLWPFIAGDLDGDGVNDVVVQQSEYDPATSISTMRMIAKKGTDGTHLWEETISADGWLSCEMWALGAGDLDGDGLDDVIVWQYRYNAPTDTGMAKVIANKGIDGTRLWQDSISASGQSNCGMSALCAGDLDGDGLDDVIVWQYKYSASTDTRTAEVIANKGIDGTHLWEESISADGDQYNCEIAPSGWTADLDGDGLNDVTVEAWKYDSQINMTTAGVMATRGISGTHLWQESISASGERTCGMAAFWARDLDGDGLDDVIVRQQECTPYPDMVTTAAKVIAKKGINGTHFWEAEADKWIWVGSGGDLNGDGKDDTLIGTSSKMYAIACTQGSAWDPWVYDETEDGIIQKTEAIQAVMDYFDGDITQAQAIEVIMLYFG